MFSEINMTEEKAELVAKVPQVTFLFWIVKILATTLGETGGDAVTMSWLGETTGEAKGTGYLIGTGIFGVIFIVAVLVQIRAKKFHPFLYWLTIVATTTVGTTLADYCTRSLGIGYTGGSTILLICVIASLLIWRWSPAVREYAAGISVDGTEQSAQRIIKTDNKHHCAERLQIFRHKTHPQLFACANDKYGDEQNDEIAFGPKKFVSRAKLFTRNCCRNCCCDSSHLNVWVNAGSSFSSDRSGRFFAGFPSRSNHAYRTGKTINVRSVELRLPPMTTVASGRCTSAPVPMAMAIGTKPRLATRAVISTGRSRVSEPSITASRTLRPCSRS